jgi:enoyl-CoA hydratase
MKQYTILKTDVSEGVAIVTVSRPTAMNALNSEFFIEFNDFLDDLEKQNDVRVLIITGEGKAFVAGADIAEMSAMDPEQALAYSKKGQTTFLRLGMMDIVVIAAVNGYALGGGCELAMACDFRIAGRNAKFGQPELSLGLIPGFAGTKRLSALTGLGNALHLILTTDMIGAEDAIRIGLVQKVVEPETLMEDVRVMAKKIAANGSQAVKKAKQLIRKGYGMPLGDASNLEAETFSGLFNDASTKEGMKAFLEKRKPNW